MHKLRVPMLMDHLHANVILDIPAMALLAQMTTSVLMRLTIVTVMLSAQIIQVRSVAIA